MEPRQFPSLQTLLNLQRQAFASEPDPSHAVRMDRLRRLEHLLRTEADAFCAAIDRDFGGRSSHETTLLELSPLLAALRHTRAHLKGWMRPERRGASIEFIMMDNRVLHQPLGVVGIMAPWNYPLLLSFGPLVDIVAAGNRAMIKPTEQLPETSELIRAAVARHFAPSEVTVVTGDVALAAEFSALPFDHLVFTGSTAVGRKVMAAAAQSLTPVTLELGGKSPAIIAPDYDLDSAARSLVWGKLANAGQTCIAPDYVLVPADKMEALATRLIAHMDANFPPKERKADYSAMAGASHRARVNRLVDECRARGARILAPGGDWSDATHVTPTVILAPPLDSELMADEIFGPVLPLIGYQRIEEAIAFVNARPRPLALYLFSHKTKVIDAVLAATRSGGVTINGTLLHIAQNDLGFGGIGPSGIGAYHGRDGFRRFSHARSVSRVRVFDPSRLATPPYGWIARLLQRFGMR